MVQAAASFDTAPTLRTARLWRLVDAHRLRLGAARAVRLAVRGIALSALVFALLTAGAWLTASSPVYLLSLAPLVGALLCGVARWPSRIDAARDADRALNLEARLATAVELAQRWPSGARGRFDLLQVEDALRAADTLDATRATTPDAQPDPDLANRVAELQAERAALDRLSKALGSVSAAEPAADAIQQGDYAAARDLLASLGEEADQLSDAAKQQLARSLQQAASATTSTDRALAERERQAATALTRGGYHEQRQALRNLGDQVSRSGAKTVSDEQLARAREVVLTQRAPGLYGLDTRVGAPGVYRVLFSQKGRDEVAAFSAPDNAELHSVGMNRAVLDGLAQATGGRELSDPQVAARPADGQGPAIALWPWLLALALLLLPLDVFLRRRV